MSGEIWNSCRYVLGARDGGREIHAAGLSCCSSGMIFFYFFYFFISKLLASKDKFGWEEALQGSRESIPPLSLSLFLLYVFWGAPSSDLRGGQQQCLTDECFLNISCAHQNVCVCVFEERGSSPGVSGGGSVSQSDCDRCQAHENQGAGVKAWRERKGRQHEKGKSCILPVTLCDARTVAAFGRRYAFRPYYNEIKCRARSSRWLRA